MQEVRQIFPQRGAEVIGSDMSHKVSQGQDMSPSTVELAVNTSPRTPALSRVPASFLTHLPGGHKPQRPHFCLRDNSGESWRACPRILQPGVS